MHIRPASTLLLAGAGKTGATGEGKLRRMEDEPLRSSAPPEFLKIAELKAWENLWAASAFRRFGARLAYTTPYILNPKSEPQNPRTLTP